jgi:hypothetical protein
MFTEFQTLALTAGKTLNPYGFALNGGFALRAHGLVNRPHVDLDFAANTLEDGKLDEATLELMTLLRGMGALVFEVSRGETWRRLSVELGEFPILVDLAVIPRLLEPVEDKEWGLVYAEEDAVCHKVNALHDRAASQDYDDYDNIMRSERWTAERIVSEIHARGLSVDFGHLHDQLMRGGPRFAAYAAAYPDTSV